MSELRIEVYVCVCVRESEREMHSLWKERVEKAFDGRRKRDWKNEGLEEECQSP